jgi:hypothetical protein
LEGKLAAVGVTKLVPNRKNLKRAFQRACWLKSIQQAIDEAASAPPENYVMPADLQNQIRERIEDSPLSWDQALWEIVNDD